MRIIDAFLYNGEPVGAFRLEYLQDHIDHFYIFESGVAQSGIYKPLYGPALLEQFPHLKHKITYVNLDDHAVDFHPIFFDESFHALLRSYYLKSEKNDILWKNYLDKSLEREVDIFRGAMQKYLEDVLHDDDILFFADVDEIPFVQIIDMVRQHHTKLQYPLYVLGHNSTFSVTSKHAFQDLFWWDAFFIRAGDLKNGHSLHEIRFRYHYNPDDEIFDAKESIVINYQNRMYSKLPAGNINRQMAYTENARSYFPSLYHLRSYFDVVGLYKKHLHSKCFRRFGLDDEFDLLQFFEADFHWFKERMRLIYRETGIGTYIEYPYLRYLMPKEFYAFGLEMGEKQRIIPETDVLKMHYDSLYSVFQDEYLALVKRIKEEGQNADH